jgi:HEAT repeat protein
MANFDILRSLFLVLATVCAPLLAAHEFAENAHLVHADGRREQVAGLERDAAGHFSVLEGDRRVPIRVGDVVAVVDAEGAETETIPELRAGDVSAAESAALEALKAGVEPDWFAALATLGQRPTRAAHEALLALAAEDEPKLRARAVQGLAAQHTKASTLAVARAALEDADAATRAAAATALFAVRAIFVRAEPGALVDAGLEHTDRDVRFGFAFAAPHGNERALDILRREGLKHSDHHRRESAALELGLRGDAAGEKILAAMLARSRLPGIDDADVERRLRVAEKVQVCEVFGALRTKAALAALRKATKDDEADVRAAAEAALAEAARE